MLGAVRTTSVWFSAGPTKREDPMPQLTIRKAGAFQREHAVPDTDIVLIGRARACDVHLPDANQRVSRYHAAIVRVPGPVPQYFLRDLGSLRSTRVAGKPV